MKKLFSKFFFGFTPLPKNFEEGLFTPHGDGYLFYPWPWGRGYEITVEEKPACLSATKRSNFLVHGKILSVLLWITGISAIIAYKFVGFWVAGAIVLLSTAILFAVLLGYKYVLLRPLLQGRPITDVPFDPTLRDQIFERHFKAQPPLHVERHWKSYARMAIGAGGVIVGILAALHFEITDSIWALYASYIAALFLGIAIFSLTTFGLAKLAEFCQRKLKS